MRIPGKVIKIMMISFLFMISCKGKDKIEIETNRVLAVRTTSIPRKDLRRKVEYVGTLKPVRETIIYARLDGSITEIPHQEGEKVKKGDVLVRIRAPKIAKQKKTLFYELEKAKLEKAHLCNYMKIDAGLIKKKVISKAKYDQSVLKCKAAKKGIKAIYSKLEEIQTIKDRKIERATEEGKVVKWLAQPGENIFPGKPVLKMASKKQEIVVNVNERDMFKGIKAGTSVLLHLPEEIAKEKRYKQIKAKVDRVSPLARYPGRLVETGISLPQKLKFYNKAGISIDVEFIIDQYPQIWVVPSQAIKIEDEKTSIFVNRKKRAHQIEVEVKLSTGGLSGVEGEINKHDQVIITGINRLQHQNKIYPVVVENEKEIQK
ncbi:MAG: efflux RND transporter periplasmic adaptor subunit [Myxococcota bacterium]